MRAELCPIHGEFVISLRSRICIDPAIQVSIKEILVFEPIFLPPEARLIPFKAAISALSAAADKLRRGRVHPKDATLVGFPVDVIANLELVLARTNRPQRDLIEDVNIEMSTKSETQVSRAALARLEPIAQRARRNELSAEDLLEALRSENDFNTARDQYLMLDAPRVAIFDDDGPVIERHAVALPRDYKSRFVHTIAAEVQSIDAASMTARLTVIEADSSDQLFTEDELGRRLMPVRVPDEADFLRLSLCLAFKLAPQLELSVTVSLSGSGIAYSATLVRFADLPGITCEIIAAIRLQPGDLFGKEGHQ